MSRSDIFIQFVRLTLIMTLVLLCILFVSNQSQSQYSTVQSDDVIKEKLVKQIEFEEEIKNVIKSRQVLLGAAKLLKRTKIDEKIEKGKKCFKTPEEFYAGDLEFLDDILISETQPTPQRSIFFHETSCFKNGIIDLTARYT